MVIAASRHWLRSFALWLSLAVVLTCALGSFGSPVQASSGSAFNAFTSDVTLGPTRASEPEKQRKAQTPGAGNAGQAKFVQAAHALVVPPPAGPAKHFNLPDDRHAPVKTGALGARAPPQR
jgi:hypothetical protein